MYLAVLFVAVLLVLWFAVLASGIYESRTGRVPPRRSWHSADPFPYFYDWHTGTWGDLFGITMIDFAAGDQLSRMHPNPLLIGISVLAGFALVTMFHLHFRSSRHRPDSGYPAPGVISLQGRMHNVYFFIQGSLAALLILLMLTNELSRTVLLISLAGGAVYMASFLSDWIPGHFDALPRI